MSSGSGRRKTGRLDYKVYSETGRKVQKERKELEKVTQGFKNLSDMASLKLIQKEKRICSALDRFVEDNELEVLFDIESLEAAVIECKKLHESYENIHIELKSELDEEYEESYKEFALTTVIFSDWIRNAKIKIQKRKVEKEENAERIRLEERADKLRKEEEAEQRRKEKAEKEERLRIEEKEERLRLRIEDKEERLRLSQEEKEREEKKEAKAERRRIEDKEERLRLSQEEKEKEERIRLEEKDERLKREEQLKNELNEEKINSFKGVYENIIERGNILAAKCNVPLISFSDSEILEKDKEAKAFNTEYTEILDRISELKKVRPPNYEPAEENLNSVSTIKINLKTRIDNFRDNLKQEIVSRDLSDEKIKNASTLKIKVPKFRGYESELDFYTFKSEFEKLISPYVQAKLLPEYLKNNYLEGQALEIVKEIEVMEEIWERLKTSFGNVTILLTNKLSNVVKGGPLWKIKNKEKLSHQLINLINGMIELNNLAKKHHIEESLFHQSNLQKIYDLIGEWRFAKFTEKTIERGLTLKEKWNKLIDFLQKELRIKEEILMNEKSRIKASEENLGETKRKAFNVGNGFPVVNKCVLCGKTDHVATVTKNGNSLINYFACPEFAKMRPLDRFYKLKSKNLCFQCLSPGFKKGHNGNCYDGFNCPHESHKKFDTGLHVLICHTHRNDVRNQELLEEYKIKNINNSNSKHRDFSKNISISFHANAAFSGFGAHKANSPNGDVFDHAIYMLQTIEVQGKTLNLFFDSGCGDLVCRKEAITKLESMGRATKVVDGPITISGVGDNKTISEHGMYKVNIPMCNGKDATLSGICLNRITADFPIYPLEEVEKDIHRAYAAVKTYRTKMPKLPHSVGGATDLMIGIQYLKYFPKPIFRLSNGLTIYESQFMNSDGSRGLVGGPHRIFTEIHRNLKGSHLSMSAYITNVVKMYTSGFKVSLEVPFLGFKESDVNKDLSYSGVFPNKRPPKALIRFEEAESAGTEISYRCVRCRGCADCKNGEKIECISIQEEVEQTVIEQSVVVDIKHGLTSAKLPFLCDPTKKLTPNRHIAMRVYESQVKKLSANPDDKNDVIMSENKLQELGFVDFLENLTVEQQNKIMNSPVNYFIPWRSVWNMNSVSTNCRLVFDASQTTSAGVSLNCLLAKGRNNLNKLVQLCIRWLVRRHAFHTDIRKMYNAIRLDEDHWCYQLYLWDKDLSLESEPKVKVIKTLIYGVKSSGNQAERGIRQTGNLMKKDYPRQNDVIHNDIYVDDCMSGEDSYDAVCESTDALKLVLNKGGFDLKGFTFSGFDPPEHLSNADKSINVGGLKWYPKSDLLSLNINELNFSKKSRGRKVPLVEGLIPEKFTRRDCAGKVAEIFDLLGKFTPITAGFKLNLSELSKRGLDWDDYVPDDLNKIWRNNFKVIKKLGQVKFKRAVVPMDAVNLDIETIEMADASQSLACASVYVRFKRKSGEFSCQLIFSRSKIIPKGMTIPRAELFAALLNATTGHVVYTALREYIKTRIHLTDSQIALFWINNTTSQMKQWVRNRVIEINRLTSRENWFYIETANMMADLGTRKGAEIVDISANSSWCNGLDWAKTDIECFPIRSVNEIKLTNNDITLHRDESLILNDEWISKQLAVDYSDSYLATNKEVLNKIGERYKFSHYIIDPNRFRFRNVVRILALIFLFVNNLKEKLNINSNLTTYSVNELPIQFRNSNDKYLVTQEKNATSAFPFNCRKGLVVALNDDLLIKALNYFYKKATLEIKTFLPKNVYKNICNEKNDILYYTGRILPSQEFDGKLNLSDVCVDLTSTSFCVPLVDKFSPVAYAVVNEIHWYSTDAKHSGNETVLRYVQSVIYIIEGRSIVKTFRKECPRCKILIKKAIDVAMGPVSSNNLCIAPAFFISQVDLFGPFCSYSNVNKRTSIKIWFVIFCCCSTGAVDLKIMEDYSTSSFILAFIRFSCRVGYPKKLMPDAGSQLVKGCQSMTLKFTDIKHQLHSEYGVEFEVCPVGAHYMHGKVERKIKHVQESFLKSNDKHRLSIIQWETLGDQIANSINNMPIALGNVVQGLENLDILTPNRLILGRNNDRCPMGAITVTGDTKKIIQANANIFETWFKYWVISYVPTLMSQPKWFNSDRDSKVGDVVLFLKSDKEFDRQYQYGIITNVKVSRDGRIREVEVQYQNHNENFKRSTNRGVREIVVIHPVDELDVMHELNLLSQEFI